mmetsp:Transcript_65308/g.143174  ORF Transcript_65308/g.143174 Transcript_65308/m.143174 type:complete len:287 (-) Transcript_65308:337-1197(-)
MPMRTRSSNATWASMSICGSTPMWTGLRWYIRHWQSPLAPQRTFKIRELPITSRMTSMQLGQRRSIKRPGAWKLCPGASRRGMKLAGSSTSVNCSWAMLISPPWPGISPSKSAKSTAFFSWQASTKRVTKRFRRLNSSAVGAAMPVTNCVSESTRNGQFKELRSTKGSRKLNSSGVSFSPAISSHCERPFWAPSTEGCSGRSRKRLPEPSLVTLAALNLPRPLPSSSLKNSTLSPDWSSVMPSSSADLWTYMSSPPISISGRRKPKPFSLSHRFTTPVHCTPGGGC